MVSEPIHPDVASEDGGRTSGTKLPWRLVLGYASGTFGAGLLPLIVGSWILYFYSPPAGEGVILLAPVTVGLIRLVERVLGAFIEPLVGHWSDRIRTRWGRRRPWMMLGLPFLVVSFVLIWFPPEAAEPDALGVIVHCAAVLMVFYASYTCVFAPYYALLPELSRDRVERIRLSVWMSLFEVLSNVAGSLGAAPLIGLGAVTIAGLALANGYQVVGLVFGIAALISVVPAILFVREPDASDQESVTAFRFHEALRECLRNPAFLPYGSAVLGFRMASMSAVIGIPFIATELMDLEASYAPLMLAVIIVVATLAFPIVERLAARTGKARVFRWGALGFVVSLPLMGTIGLVPGLSPVAHGAVLFVLSGFSVATLFVLPRALLADVVDADEERTGRRREAMYTGMSGVVEKLGEALATGSVGFLFQFLGNSAADPMGIRLLGVVAAAAVGLGIWGFSRYPLD